MLSEPKKKILAYISSHELDITKRPFLKMANALGIKEKDIMRILAELQKKEIISGLKAVLNHVKAGYKENALICWRIRPDTIDGLKNVFIKNSLISHCYKRRPHREFNYNLFTMMHAKNKKCISNFVRRTAETFALDYVILFTEKELKKEKLDLGMVYNTYKI